MDRMKILIADDEPKILNFLTDYLQREGFETIKAVNGQEALEQYAFHRPDLVILDIMMPKMDGYEVCRQIRQQSNVPIIFLSAKNEALDRIMGLTLGSDDYLTKPFDNAELLLRVKAVLRRSVESRGSEKNEEKIHVPGLVINRTTRVVEHEEKEIELTPKEFDLLWLLATHPTQVFTRDQLIYQIWDTDYVEDTGVVTTLVKRLREKIESDSANPRYIKTVRGVGYKFGVKPC